MACGRVGLEPGRRGGERERERGREEGTDPTGTRRKVIRSGPVLVKAAAHSLHREGESESLGIWHCGVWKCGLAFGKVWGIFGKLFVGLNSGFLFLGGLGFWWPSLPPPPYFLLCF